MCVVYLKEKIMPLRARLLTRLRHSFTRTKKCPPNALAYPTTTEYKSDYEFQHQRDSYALGHNSRTGVEL